MMLAGACFSQGTSLRTPRQSLLKRHISAGSQLTPDSISTTFSSGYFANTPSDTRFTTWLPKPWAIMA